MNQMLSKTLIKVNYGFKWYLLYINMGRNIMNNRSDKDFALVDDIFYLVYGQNNTNP